MKQAGVGASAAISALLGNLALFAALLAVAMTTWRMLTGARPADSLAARSRNVAGWEQLSAIGARIGPETAKVVITEFMDYQCPSCAAYEPALRQIVDAYPDVAMVIRHFPLERIHPVAREAALASECARKEGHFARMHQVLLSRQKDLPARNWDALAIAAGVANRSDLKECMRDKVTADRVKLDIAAGQGLGVEGTPTFMVNNQLLPLGVSPQRVRLIVEQLRNP